MSKSSYNQLKACCARERQAKELADWKIRVNVNTERLFRPGKIVSHYRSKKKFKENVENAFFVPTSL